MARVPLQKYDKTEASGSEDEVMNAEASKFSARQISQASTAFSLEELSSPDFFSRQCLEIDSLACRVAEESNINQAMMTAAVSNGNFCVTVANPRHSDFPLIAVSEKFEAMTGHSRAEMLGKSCRILNDGCTNDTTTYASLRGACHTGSSFTGVLTNRRKSGEFFLNLLDLHGLTVASNRRTGEPLWFLIGIHSDVTEEAVVAGGELPRARVEQIHEVAKSIRSKLTEDFSRMAMSGALLANLDVPEEATKEEWVLLPTPEWGVWRSGAGAGAPEAAEPAPREPGAGLPGKPAAEEQRLRPRAAAAAPAHADCRMQLLAGAAGLACAASALALGLRRRALSAAPDK